MKTPTIITPEEFFATAQSFLAAHYSEAEEAEGLLCKHCQSLVNMEPVTVALHEADLERCVDTGAVQFMRIPFCPKCEHAPSPEGCLHVASEAAFREWCNLHKELSALLFIRDRRGGDREGGIARRKIVREFFEGEAAPQALHAFARPDIHEVLTEFGYWINEVDGDFSTYVRRGGTDYVETHRLDGSWRHVIPDDEEAEGLGSETLRGNLQRTARP
jgi:hypothetical protein